MYKIRNRGDSNIEVYIHAIPLFHILAFRFSVCNIVNFYQTHNTCKKIFPLTQLITVFELPQFLIENAMVLVSICVCLKKKTRWPPS